VLRKAAALGGKANSAELRDWAQRELMGYGPDDELPAYRRISAPLQMDAATMTGFIKNQSLSSWQLPDFAQDKITNAVEMREGIAEIEEFARRTPPGEVVKPGPPLSQELVMIMNGTQQWSGHIERIYWAVAPVTLNGVVEQVRNALTVLVSEIQANVPDGAVTPSAEVATHGLHVAVSGKRNKINLTASQGSTITSSAPEEPRRWLRIGWSSSSRADHGRRG
jgi:hypothetical protein